jgi:hypothetical protein
MIFYKNLKNFVGCDFPRLLCFLWLGGWLFLAKLKLWLEVSLTLDIIIFLTEVNCPGATPPQLKLGVTT